MNSLGINLKRETPGFSLERLVAGMIETNVYFLIDTASGSCFVVDPGDEADRIIRFMDGKHLIPQAILLTHGHFDHSGAAQALKEHYQIPIYAYEKEAMLLADPMANGSGRWGEPLVFHADKWLKDGQILNLEGHSLRVIHTPGHTSGSCCFYLDAFHILISGDTLFHGSYGRTDLETGSDEDILRSVRMLLKTLPEDTLVYPGHGSPTFIAFERRYNPLAERT